MNIVRSVATAWIAVALGIHTSPAMAQGVLVDEGEFSIRIEGAEVGTETFSIRRAGSGVTDPVFATGVITIETDQSRQVIRPLLHAVPPDGTAERYQVDVEGENPAEIALARSGRRYVATIRSEMGAEDREFQRRPDSRIVEVDVAHHYYFLRGLRPGASTHVLEPRHRRQLTLTASSRRDEELNLGPNVVASRRVTLVEDSGEERVVWFDRQGRVLRVEVSARGYVAIRTDLVG